MTSRGLRLLAYGRVSDVRGRSGDSFISPEDQMRRCRDYARAYDHTIIEEGLDLDVSGGVMSRPVLDRFLQEIQDGRAEGLIVAKLDRFARSSRGALNALAEIEAAGGVLISVQEQIDSTTAAGRFVRAIFLATAEWERERIGETWLSAKASAVGRGIHISAHVPPGYRRRKDRRLEPHPKHAATLRGAFEMAAQGEPYARIADFLTRSHLPSAGNGDTHWTANRIARLLANRVYLGEARYGNLVNPDAHEPIASRELWTLAQRKPRGPALSTTGTYMLTGLARCAECLYSMRPQKARGKTIATYRCQTTTATGRCAHPSSIAMSRLDDYVIGQFLAAGEEMFFVGTGARDDDGAARLLAEAIAAEDSYRASLTNVVLRQQIGDSDHDALIASLHAEWQEKLAAVDDAAPTSPVPFPRGVSLRELVERLRGEGEIEELRRLLGSGIEAILVRPARNRAHNVPVDERVEIVWRSEGRLVLPQRGRRFERV